MGFMDEPVPQTGSEGAATPPDLGTEGTPAPPAPTDAPDAPVPVADAPTYIDTEAMGSHLVKVKIDGSEVEMPLNDALQGVMRQQDYTRKTQEVAETRRRLAQAQNLVDALDNDPVGTLKQLTDIYGLDPSEGFQPAEVDPIQQQLRSQEAAIAEMRQAAVRQQITAEVESLKAQYGEFDVQSTAGYAMEHGMTLTNAYKAMNFDNLRNTQGPSLADQNRERARQAQNVEGGARPQNGVVRPKGQKVNSFRDAWFAAKSEHNI